MENADGYLTRRKFNGLLLGATAAVAMPFGSAFGQGLKKMVFGAASKTITPLLAPFVVPEYLGYFKEEGLQGDVAVLGSNAAVAAAAEQGRVETVVGVPSFQLQMLADGKPVNFINFFEYSYPFKWGVAVKPDSPIKTLAQLKGKKIGVHNFGTSEYQVGKILVKLSGLDPEKDVSWLSVGEAAGFSLAKGDIEALVYFDTGFGTIEASGIKLAYLPLPPNVPKVGGLYIGATRKMFTERRADLVKYGRAVAKAMFFIEENPEAASYIFLQMFPEAAPRNKSTQEKVEAILNPMVKRLPSFRHYDKSIKGYGYISQSELREDVEFLGLQSKIKDSSHLYTNDLIKEINAFDREVVKKHARDFKLPYKS